MTGMVEPKIEQDYSSGMKSIEQDKLVVNLFDPASALSNAALSSAREQHI